MPVEDLYVKEQAEEFEIEHNGQVYQFAKRELSWLKTNKILSKAAKITQKGVEIALDVWYEEYLSEALTKAPWNLGETRIALRRLDPAFGAKLEKHIPRPGGFSEDLDFFGQE